MDSQRPRLWRSPHFWILATFAISRILYFLAGVRFDARPIPTFFQIADPLLLKTRLVETIFNLHTQPPGFNLMIGLVLKVFPSSYASVLHVIYLLCGLSLCFSLYQLLRFLNVRPWLAALLTAVFIASPGVVMFENFLLYEYPVMAILCGSAVLLFRFCSRPAVPAGMAFFISLVALMYFRALFHLVWFAAVALFLVWAVSKHRRVIVIACAVPAVFAVALYAKNLLVIGSFTSSTWMGFNAETIAMHQLTDEEMERLIRAGTISELSRISSYGPVSAFKGKVPSPAATGIPVLDQEYDSTGRINYNNIGYLAVHPYKLKDAEAVIIHYPKAYVRTLSAAWFAYFLPTGDFPFFDLNRPKIEPFDRAFNIIAFGQWKDASNRKELRRVLSEGGAKMLPLYTGTYLLVGLPVLFGWGIWFTVRTIKRGGWNQPVVITLSYMLFTIAFITATVNLLSAFENNRYRLPLDPFFLALLGMALEALMSRRQTFAAPGPERSTAAVTL